MMPINDPRWIGRGDASAIRSPSALNRLAVQSRRSLILLEYAARTRASVISSTTDESADPMTSTRTGSTVAGDAVGARVTGPPEVVDIAMRAQPPTVMIRLP